MARQTIWAIALLVACAPASFAAGIEEQHRAAAAQAGPHPKDRPQPASAGTPKPNDRERWKWWLYDRAELGITDQQSRDINAIFEATIPKLRETRQELDRAEEELSRMIREHKADIAAISAQLDRVESVRSQHNKMRTLMLYRIHQLLSAEQRTKLEALRARQEAARKDGQPSGFRRYP